jgi:hypothetical protein
MYSLTFQVYYLTTVSMGYPRLLGGRLRRRRLPVRAVVPAQAGTHIPEATVRGTMGPHRMSAIADMRTQSADLG